MNAWASTNLAKACHVVGKPFLSPSSASSLAYRGKSPTQYTLDLEPAQLPLGQRRRVGHLLLFRHGVAEGTGDRPDPANLPVRYPVRVPEDDCGQAGAGPEGPPGSRSLGLPPAGRRGTRGGVGIRSLSCLRTLGEGWVRRRCEVARPA